WLDSLPHARGPAVRPRRGVAAVEFGALGDERVLAAVAVASARADLPGAHRVVLSVGRSSEVVAHPDLARRGSIVPELVSSENALTWAMFARSSAESDGLVSATAALPGSVALGDLSQPDTSRVGLPAVFAVAANEPVVLDLVEHGPHAVVGGTTGSGKSELLTSWVLAIASARSPQEVTFLLVDFKGGSAFGSLVALPHTVGLITDLDESEAQRALESLRAELRHRERELAAAGAKDVADLAPGRLARLVVIVDEFAAMMADYPELHGLFSDVAARGRSLGVHLVLCTQRPAAVARDAVLANADLRISLRVNNRADSIAVVGTDAAASIVPSARGRAVLSLAGEPGRVVQVAIASPADVDRVLARWPGDWTPRRPWCPPLPTALPFDGAFGLLDLPAEQRQEPARYDPVEHGHVLVLGAHRAGRTTAIAALAASVGTAEAVPTDIEGAWDAIAGVRFSASVGHRLLVLDDLDALLPRFSDEHRAAFIERLTRVLRDGPAVGIRMVISAQRVTGELQPLVSLASARLLLRQASRQEHSLAGGEPGGFASGAPAGRGEWLGNRVQVALGAPWPSPPPPSAPGVVSGRRPLAIVASRPAELAPRLGAEWAVTSLDGAPRDSRGVFLATGAVRSAIVGDAEEWQSHWGALAALRASSDILFHGCSLADYRALTRSRDLPPPIADPPTTGWLLTPDGAVTRATLPGAG
ncbi:MAG: FtsK/SpoIIIE domain-containing protein, partial [Rhodoglobus sp.]